MTADRPLSLLEVLTAQPRTKRDLAQAMAADTRSIEAEVQRLRLAGIPILSDGDGYRLAQTAAEVRQCSERLRSRAIRQMETATALADAAERMESLTMPWSDAA